MNAPANDSEMKRVAFVNLVITVMVDLRVTEHEVYFLNQARQLLDISWKDAWLWTLEAFQKPGDITVPDSEDDREYCFNLMIGACKADREFHVLEEKLLVGIAGKFGLDPGVVRQRYKNA